MCIALLHLYDDFHCNLNQTASSILSQLPQARLIWFVLISKKNLIASFFTLAESRRARSIVQTPISAFALKRSNAIGALLAAHTRFAEQIKVRLKHEFSLRARNNANRSRTGIRLAARLITTPNVWNWIPTPPSSIKIENCKNARASGL